MSDPELGLDENGREILLSCHILARAVGKVFPVTVRDGHFAGSFQHSWLETEHGNVVDVYPVAMIGGPIMYDGDTCSPKGVFIRPAPQENFLAAASVRILSAALSDVLYEYFVTLSKKWIFPSPKNRTLMAKVQHLCHFLFHYLVLLKKPTIK